MELTVGQLNGPHRAMSPNNDGIFYTVHKLFTFQRVTVYHSFVLSRIRVTVYPSFVF
jgi:hypothetical protein